MRAIATDQPIKALDILAPSNRQGSVAASQHPLEKERGTCVAGLIAQITRPVRFHVPSILGTSLATDNDPINATPKPRPQVKSLKQWRDRQPMHAGG